MFEKICTQCHELKTIDLFYIVRRKNKEIKYTAACKKCTNKKTSIRGKSLKGREENKKAVKNWQLKNKEKRKNYELLRTYGITLEDYKNLLEDQKNACAICEKSVANSKRKELYVDHCHTTTKVRGLLCQKCNQGLGLFDDSAKNLANAIEYLRRNNHE